MTESPNREGFFWAKWKIAAEGADRCRYCGHVQSDFETEGLSHSDWEVVQVVDNNGPKGAAEEYLVQVPGVGRWQPRENFFWGQEVRRG